MFEQTNKWWIYFSSFAAVSYKNIYTKRIRGTENVVFPWRCLLLRENYPNPDGPCEEVSSPWLQQWAGQQLQLSSESWPPRLQNCCNQLELRIAFFRSSSQDSVSILFFFSHPEVDLLVCFGALYICRTKARDAHQRGSSQTGGL